MPNADPLSALKDIHLPKPIGWWPIAPGWYLLMALTLLLIGLLVRFFYRQQQQAQAKKKALHLLKDYYQQYQNTQNAPVMSAKVNELLKRVALVYYPRQQVAPLQDEAWLNFLNETSQHTHFKEIADLLLETPYQRQSEKSLEPLFQNAKKWIEQRRAPCSN